MKKSRIKEQEKQAHELGMSKKKERDFMEWYYEVLQKADLVDMRFRVKGFDVYMPNAMLAMEQIEGLFDSALRATGHMPVMFPVVIPESSFSKETEHIRGFNEEVFWITRAGKRKLEEKMILRPTSETSMYPLYSLWIRSYMHLPLKFYQKGRVYRYETKMTRPLLRPREFRWFEAHDVQMTKEEAEKQVEEDMAMFKEVVTDSLCIHFLLLKRTEWDKFPGADETYAFETVMPDGKVLQIGTTHDLGQRFAKVFKIQFMDKQGKKKYAYQTCFGPGISRIFGAVVGMHGDDKGLIMPPAIAPVQAVIVPIYTKDTKAKIYAKCGQILGWLAEKDFRVHFDSREQYTPGFKFHEWELKGVPVRIEIGPKDVEKGVVSIVRRDFLERTTIPEEKLGEHLLEVLDSMTFQLNKRSSDMLAVHGAENYADLKKKLKKGGFVRAPFCMKEKCNDKLEKQTGAEVRGTLFGEAEKAEGKCAVCGKKAKEIAYIAESY